MRRRTVDCSNASFRRDVSRAAEAGLRQSVLTHAVKLIWLDMFPHDRGDPISFTSEGNPVYPFDAGGGWEIEFSEEERADTGETVIHLLSLHRTR
jgi:hypothetical protein